MTNLFSKINKSGIIILFAIFCMVAFTSCLKDEPDSDLTLNFKGVVTTGVPGLEGVKNNSNVVFGWTDDSKTKATIKVEAFNINIPGLNLGTFELAELYVPSITTTLNADGSYTISNNNFTGRLGIFPLTGSIDGTLKNNNDLSFSILYKLSIPAVSQPITLQSEFVTTPE